MPEIETQTKKVHQHTIIKRNISNHILREIRRRFMHIRENIIRKKQSKKEAKKNF